MNAPIRLSSQEKQNKNLVQNTGSILLVEPDEAERERICQSLSARMTQAEGEICCVATGEEAFWLIEQKPDEERFGLVIVCAVLSGMTAGQFVRRLRLNRKMRSVPVLMLTEDTTPLAEQESLDSRADAYISRSAHHDLLLLRVRALLESDSESGIKNDATLRRSKIVIIHPEEEHFLDFWDDASVPLAESSEQKQDNGPGLGELLWRDGHTVTSVERSRKLIEGGWLSGMKSPDCLVIDDMDERKGDLEFCRLLEVRRQAIKDVGGTPFRLLGIVEAERFRQKSSCVFFDAGIDDLVPSDISPEALAVRIRIMAQSRIAEERRTEGERERQKAALILEAARTKAEMAEALSEANHELAQTNKQLIQAQSQLVHAAKMASLGELVAGIAHEINNPLAFTLSHINTVTRGLHKMEQVIGQKMEEETKPLQIDVEQRQAITGIATKLSDRLIAVKGGLQRIQDLVLRLRCFSRLDEAIFRPVNIPDALRASLDLLAHKMGENKVQMICRLQAPPVLICQHGLINQAVMNIIANALDALNQQPASAEKGWIMISTRLERKHYVITVADNGYGLDDEVKTRIFDPFFTTKPVGEGVGLGLAIAHTVLEAHRGTVTVSDTVSWLAENRKEHEGEEQDWDEDILHGLIGKGACFHLVVPVMETEQGLAAQSASCHIP